ncbi:MAG TPA: magnesium/cobalt transporter CorA [Dissulfurispiraceae bacterium]|nr:magnesium/cobalt transporter CorA [Dissulfurispiraceae bacterium]
MRKLIKDRSKKIGQPPGTLIHIGDEHLNDVRISVLDYSEDQFREIESASAEACYPFKDSDSVTWINIEGLHQPEVFEKLGQCYGLHPLVLEDIMATDQRPKMEDFGDYIFIVLKMITYDGRNGGPDIEQVSLILGKNFVLSFQEGKAGDVFDPIRQRLRTAKGRIRKMGADYLVYGLMDSIVDNYFGVLEKLGEEIEAIEDRLVADPAPETLRFIHALKRDMIFLRKSVWPLREVIGSLERGESTLVTESTGIYLRDVYDHTIQVIDTIETFRDMLSGMLDIYLSSVSNRLNAVMKVLTVISTIFFPLSFIVGLYGMNFKYMPELEWRWGYPTVLVVMLTIAACMLLLFKRKKWL